ncbi:uncharacterized protein LACBIDRAFT_318565 [Laccaria bicolor S238N-H82]|uniref:Predicted protein n=1 Tax=Laccaria bicolor (strain S238N-H82 / ATCC MYA-4686) TaxID=486041 RepID=B0E2N7_LACBS|nr:uncharacterized protein LACBIDRAFT_318565 [Laccaria bicolor S238N-H82]EDQ98911.1 predicted protein [Laccaria bicolor S238N-H82]|eukprot:XP_001890456.1 predicted protein [Laccaria bicolor S238N-H82]
MAGSSDQVDVSMGGGLECSQQVLPISTDILSSYLPTTPSIAPLLEMTVAFDQIEGPVQGAVDSLQHPSPISTDLPGSDLPISLSIPSALNAELMPASQYSYEYSSGLLKLDRPCRVLNKLSS